MSILFILLIPLALYFLMIRPQRQRVQAQRNLMSALTPGDRVVTAGGMLGTLVGIEGDTASVEVAPGVVIDLLLPAISRRIDPGGPAVGGYVDNVDDVDDVVDLNAEHEGDEHDSDGDHDPDDGHDDEGGHDGPDHQDHHDGEESNPVAPTEES
jgi:preprotein translocase subunit YajC